MLLELIAEVPVTMAVPELLASSRRLSEELAKWVFKHSGSCFCGHTS